MKEKAMRRRQFLGTSAAGAGVALTGLHQAATTRGVAFRGEAANETIRVGVVGPGGRGTGLMTECTTFGKRYNARVTAVCDIWNQRREAAAARIEATYGKRPKVYRRLEEVLADDEIDAVIIATADHQHAKMLKMAVEAGKDVYCEKPMANAIEEGNDALDAVRRTDRVVQIGTQRRSDPKYRQAARLVAEGAVGDVVKVDVIWNAYSPYRWAKKAPELSALKQSDVDWPAFLMGKPARPFDPRIYRSFRLFRNFSSGIIDQWMTHGVDAVHLLTGTSFPLSAVGHGGIYKWHDYRENPDTVQIALEYERDGQKFLATYATSLINGAGSATRVHGTRGTLEAEKVWRLSGEGTNARDRIAEPREIAEAPETLPHMANWLDCVRRRDRQGLACPVEAGYGHSVACIMSTEALQEGRRMVFDPESRVIRPG